MPRREFDLRRFDPIGYHVFNSLSDFLSEPIRDGVSEIQLGGMPFHLKFRGVGAQTTLVYFAAALPDVGWDQYPVFAGVKSATALEANHLALSDPNFALDGRPSTGWYAGNIQQPVQEALPDIIRHATKAGVEEQAVLVGSSAGGFGSLYYGARFPKSVSVCVNPCVELLNKPMQFEDLAHIAFPGLSRDELLARVDVSAAEGHATGLGNTVLYIQNVQDKIYFDHNFVPFMERVGARKTTWMQLVDSGPGHRHPDREFLFSVVEALVAHAPDWRAAAASLDFIHAPTLGYALRIQERMLRVARNAARS